MSKNDTTESRLIRLESKLVRGFEELGVSISAERNWLVVDNEQRTIYLTTIGSSIVVINAEMQRQGATHDEESYKMIFKGNTIGTIIYYPKNIHKELR